MWMRICAQIGRAASRTQVARCEPCGNLIDRSLAIYGGVTAGVVAALFVTPFLWGQLPALAKDTVDRLLRATKPET